MKNKKLIKSTKLPFDPKTVKIESAPFDKVDSPELAPYVAKILKAVGHPEAYVTDESSIWDFLDVFDSKAKKNKTVEKIAAKLKVKILSGDYLWEIAKKMENQHATKRKKRTNTGE